MLLILLAVAIVGRRIISAQRSGTRAFLLVIVISASISLLSIPLMLIPESLVLAALPYVPMALVLAIYLFIRGRRYERPRLFPVLGELRRSLLLMSKALLILYFILLLGQLPSRYQTTHVMQQIAENEVQYVMTHGK